MAFVAIRPDQFAPVALAAVGVAALMAATKDLSILIYGLVGYLFFEGLVKNLFPHTVVFFMRDIILAAIYLVWFVRYPLTRGFRGRYDKFVSLILAAFVFYVVLITLAPFTDERFLYRLGGARWWLANIPLLFVGADVFATRARFDRLCYVFLLFAALTGAYGLLQYLIGFDHLTSVSSSYDSLAAWSQWYGVSADEAFRRRIFSTFDLPTTFAYAMQVATLLATAYAVHARRRLARLGFALLTGLFFAALLLSGTREAYVPFVVALGLYVAWEPKKKALLGIGFSLLLGLAAVIVFSQAIYLYRITLVATDFGYTLGRVSWDWEKALFLVRDHPLGLGIATSAKIGRAFGDAESGSTFRFIENGYGQALVSLGWPGLVLLVTLLVAVASRLGVSAWRERSRQWRPVLAFAFCASQLFPMFTHMTLYAGLWPVVYWLFAGSAVTFLRGAFIDGPGLFKSAPATRRTTALVPRATTLPILWRPRRV